MTNTTRTRAGVTALTRLALRLRLRNEIHPRPLLYFGSFLAAQLRPVSHRPRGGVRRLPQQLIDWPTMPSGACEPDSMGRVSGWRVHVVRARASSALVETGPPPSGRRPNRVQYPANQLSVQHVNTPTAALRAALVRYTEGCGMRPHPGSIRLFALKKKKKCWLAVSFLRRQCLLAVDVETAWRHKSTG